ncbi:hypothetical protein OSB04_006627 [Centaurea solstitialis]|uniref:Uncharacterized protein n=1 Tax=Centaurea solstitialis TaxID=347529 RepID=A0AA38WHU7_9ASTR|nr:hypothetical protein OSB04_006627 [Centaurea solstitialis]
MAPRFKARLKAYASNAFENHTSNKHAKLPTDDTAQAKIVFFDDAATMLFQTDCKAIIDQLGYTNPYALPEPLNIIKGQTKIFQLHFTRSSKAGDIGLVADVVFEEIVVVDEASQIQTYIINHAATSSATEKTPVTTTTELTSIAPASPARFHHDQLVSTPITPLSTLTTTPPTANPNAQTIKTRHCKQTSTRKQLFHTSSSDTYIFLKNTYNILYIVFAHCVAQEDDLPLKKQKTSVGLPDETMKGCTRARSTKKQ